MDETVEIHYSKPFAYFSILIMIGLLSFLTYLVLNMDPSKWKGERLMYFSISGLILLALIGYEVIKFLIPAIKNQSAIILNNEFIINNVGNIIISWNNVKEIRSIKSRANFIAIDLINNRNVTSQTKNIFKKVLYANNKFFYGTLILISTQFLEGSSEEISSIFFLFFQQTRKKF